MTNRAREFILHRSRHIEPDGKSLGHYKTWVEWETESNESFPDQLRIQALERLTDTDRHVVRSAIQALGCVGTPDDVTRLNACLSEDLEREIAEAIKLIVFRQKSVFDLLEEVNDYESFKTFVLALADEREKAEKLEKLDPIRYADAAYDWKNSDIASYLGACLAYFERRDRNIPHLTWHELAHFLYTGKIIE